MHTTNYTNTLIEVADDCKTDAGTQPPERQTPTIARRQYELLRDHPYQYTSDDLLFAIHTERNGIAEGDRAAARAAFFAKGQACLRSSPLAKQYGWGIHHNAEAKIALLPRESEEYARLKNDANLTHVKAMRSSR